SLTKNAAPRSRNAPPPIASRCVPIHRSQSARGRTAPGVARGRGCSAVQSHRVPAATGSVAGGAVSDRPGRLSQVRSTGGAGGGATGGVGAAGRGGAGRRGGARGPPPGPPPPLARGRRRGVAPCRLLQGRQAQLQRRHV